MTRYVRTSTFFLLLNIMSTATITAQQTTECRVSESDLIALSVCLGTGSMSEGPRSVPDAPAEIRGPLEVLVERRFANGGR